MPLDIAIIGCGTAGQAVSIFLTDQGHRVTVFERAPELSPVGAGLLVQPTGQRVLDELGAGDSLRKVASPITHLVGTSLNGTRVLDLEIGRASCRERV